MSIGMKETVKAVALYNQLSNLREGLIYINTTTDFAIHAKDTWLTTPINADTARAFFHAYFNKCISEIEEQLTTLGFDPNEAGA